MSSIPQWQLDMARAVGDDLMRSIVEDHRRGPPSPGSSSTPSNVTVVGSPRVVSGNDGVAHGGWREPPSIDKWKPPGLEIMDRVADHFAAIDRAERARQLAEAARTEKEIKRLRDKGLP
jgi:hypothetical protein